MDSCVEQINDEQHFSPTSSIVPRSLLPPSCGASSNLATYISDPTSCQPSKKAYQGMNSTSTVTASFSTSSDASPTRISIYTNKRNALASPAKGGATRTKDVVDLTAMDDGSKGGAKNSKDDYDLLGKAGGSPWNLPVGTNNSKPPTKSATTTSNPTAPAGGAAQILQSDSIMFKSQLYPAKKPTILLSLPEALAKFHRQLQLMTRSSQCLPLAPTPLPVTPEALAKFHGLLQLMLGLILFLPIAFIPTQVMPEALPNFHRHIQLMTTLGYRWRE
jgi:hypothetical protein